MKSYNHIYETLFEHDNLVSAVKQSIQGRKPQRRKKIEKYIKDIEDTAEQLKNMVTGLS